MRPDRFLGTRASKAPAPNSFVLTAHAGAAFLVMLLSLCPGRASAIDMDVLVGFGQSISSGSYYRPNSWTPLTVYLTGQSVRGVGQLQVSVHINGRETIYTRRVSLSEGEINQAENFAIQLYDPDQYAMYVGGTQPEIEIQLLLDGRSLAGPKKVALPGPVAAETYNVLGLTRDGSGFNFLARKKLGLVHRHFNPANVMVNTLGQNGERSPNVGDNGINPNATLHVVYDDPRALPTFPQAYAMIDAIALADQPLDNLTQDQVEALKGYVRDGGLLIVSGGGDVTRLRSEFFQEMLPIDRPQVAMAASLPELARRYARPLPLNGGTALAMGTLKPGARTLLADDTGRPLISARPYGDGVVVFTAFDYLDRSLLAWNAGPSLWRDLLRSGNDTVSGRDVLTSIRDGQGSGQRMVDELAGARAKAKPPLMLIVLFCSSYLILLIPVNYFILKKLDRRELSWVTAPILIVGFSIASYLLARSIKGGALTSNRAVVLETQANSDQVAGYAQMTLYSPQRATYTIAMGPPDSVDNPYRLYCPSEIFPGTGSLGSELTVDYDQTGVTLRNALIRLWDKGSFDIPVATTLGGPDRPGSIDASTSFEADGTHVRVTLTNNTRFTLEHGVLVGSDRPVAVGSLAPGQAITKTVLWNKSHSAFSIPLPEFGENSPTAEDESPEAIRNRIRFALAQTLSSGADRSQNYVYNGQGDYGYGHPANAFVGWFSSPLLEVRVDEQQPSGEEVNVLIAHLPAPFNAPPDVAGDLNPFAVPAVNRLEDVTKSGAGGVLR